MNVQLSDVVRAYQLLEGWIRVEGAVLELCFDPWGRPEKVGGTVSVRLQVRKYIVMRSAPTLAAAVLQVHEALEKLEAM